MKQFNLLKNKSKSIIFAVILIFALVSTIIYLTIGQRGYDSVLVVLALQFLKWKIALPTTGLPIRDVADYYNNYYVYFGPLSSLLLMPFALIFGYSTPQVLIGV